MVVTIIKPMINVFPVGKLFYEKCICSRDSVRLYLSTGPTEIGTYLPLEWPNFKHLKQFFYLNSDKFSLQEPTELNRAWNSWVF